LTLGTTFVAAAVARDGHGETFPLGHRSTVMHAAVYVRDDGRLVNGDAAARRAVTDRDRVALNIKRKFGIPTPLVVGGAPHVVMSPLEVVSERRRVAVADERASQLE
jgi:molecular chaperone DnaK